MQKDDDTKFEIVENYIKNHKSDKKIVEFKMLTFEDIQIISIETANILRQPVSMAYVVQIIGLLSIKHDCNMKTRNPVLTVEDIAEVCHEVKKCYCQSLGDLSTPPWNEAPGWQKVSALEGVRFHLEHPESKPIDSHFIWLTEKLQEGWKFGTVKDPENKKHPCIMAFKELPEKQKAKNYLFLGVVRVLQKYTLT